ncbi:MAG: peptidoglycan DD-metalloendopeptidase family protein [Eubacteriaceae bacterium]|nr:peptidoglycan DD-metalloendopeptidase family protein [Eubacteriaceae bacterium]
MKSRRLNRIITFILLFFLFFTVIPVKTARAATLQEQLAELEKQIEEYRNNANKQSELAKALRKELYLIDQQISAVEEQIKALNDEIAEVELRIEKASESLEQAEADRIAYQEQLEKRITVMYMYGDTEYLEVLFGAQDFSDFISRANAIASIIEYDNLMAQKLKENEALIAEMKRQIEEQKVKLETLKASKTAQEKQLASQKRAKDESLKKIQETKAYWDALVKEEEKEAATIRNKIASESSNSNYANTYKTFIWPTPGYYSITSPFGYRIHPISHVRAFHGGIDIGAPKNARAVATANGKVIYASWNGGYGNCIILDLGKDSKGNSYAAVYAHLNGYAVSVGDIVTQGQVIGYVGTTGLSTGYHLHFEIRINNTRVNPVNYVTK